MISNPLVFYHIPIFIDLQQLSLDSIESFFYQFSIKIWGGLRRVQGVGPLDRPRQEDFQQAPSVYLIDVYLPLVEEIALTALAPMPSENYGEVSDILQSEIHSALSGLTTPQEALDNACAAIDAISMP